MDDVDTSPNPEALVYARTAHVVVRARLLALLEVIALAPSKRADCEALVDNLLACDPPLNMCEEILRTQLLNLARTDIVVRGTLRPPAR